MIVVLDGYCLNPGDLSWEGLDHLGVCVVHDRTAAQETAARARDAEIVLTTKTRLPAAIFDELPRLRYIGVLATGYDVVDVAEARRRGIAVTNIPTYGTDSVAQFTMALLLELCHHVGRHAADVAGGGWVRNPDWSYSVVPSIELAGKTMGIIGYGRIGRKTGQLAEAFGMRLLPVDAGVGSMEEALANSDVISLHCPLTPDTVGLINRDRIAKMKPGAFVLNTARGALVNESDLAGALNSGRLGGAGLDVLSVEPPVESNPLFGVKNCIITPHIAWSTREARARLIVEAVENAAAFLRGETRNRVV